MEEISNPIALVLGVVDAANIVERRLDSALGHIKGITFSEYRLLQAIAAAPSGSASRVDLAEAVGLSPSGVTRALKPLEKLGFVETVRDLRDARQAKAGLTGQGLELEADAAGVIADAIESLLAKADQPLADFEVTQRVLGALSR